jgi:hypothetical protein
MSMARLRRDQGRRDEARELLAPVYGLFTEGFDTRDLKETKALRVLTGPRDGSSKSSCLTAQRGALESLTSTVNLPTPRRACSRCASFARPMSPWSSSSIESHAARNRSQGLNGPRRAGRWAGIDSGVAEEPCKVWRTPPADRSATAIHGLVLGGAWRAAHMLSGTYHSIPALDRCLERMGKRHHDP